MQSDDKELEEMEEDILDEDYEDEDEEWEEDIAYEVVSNHGDRVLIEYESSEGITKRGILPTKLHNQFEGLFDEDKETLVVPYGVDWYDLLDYLVPEKEDFIDALVSRLLEMGVWTYEDFRKKQPSEITGAIMKAAGFDYQKLNRLIESNK